MSKIHLSKAESWDAIYKASKFINFTSFDYANVKQSLIDYFKLMHPEFNNWIETDEFVMNIEAFAYICELYSYRLDMLSNENLLSLAQRKDSVLRLAKFISYKPSRNKPGIGLVKITSISTTENVYDINGNNLAKTKIIWNDASNPNWKHQFFAVLNSVIKQSFGDVEPIRRKQVYDQVYELYTFNNVPLVNCVIPYKVSVQSKTIQMNLASSELTNDGPVEQRPHTNNQFNILYGTDGLGDASVNTGFFILTKQGDLSRVRKSFTDLTPHAFYQPSSTNINDIDVWVNEITVNTADESKNVLNTPLWVETDTTNAQNVIFSDNSSRYRYEIETLINDGIKIWFGDDDYAKIPYGDFDIWYRTSSPDPVVIPESAINNITSNVNYLDANKTAQVLTFTYSLLHPIQNASASEELDHIKINAPATYYTQNRMVTARDYNSYMLRDSAILKLKSINRTYVGASKYTELHDSSDTYQHITHLGTDLSLYVNDYTETINIPINTSPLTVITNYIQPLLSNTHVAFFRLKTNIVNRRYFTNTELHSILFDFMGTVYYVTDGNPPNPKYPFAIYGDDISYIPALVTTPDWLFHVSVTKTEYVISYNAAKLVAHSPTTKFRVYERGDTITLLETNSATKRTKNNMEFLPYNIEFPVLGSKIYNSLNEYNGLPDYNSVEVTINDKNNDGIPDVADLSYVLDNKLNIDLAVEDYYTASNTHKLFNHVFDMPFDSLDVGVPTLDLGYEFLAMDIEYTGDVDSTTIVIDEIVNKDIRPVANTITVSSYGLNTKLTITIKDYVYFERASRNHPFVVTDQEVKRQWYTEHQANNHVRYDRKSGRINLSYLWKHVSMGSNRINPSTSNIIDTFIITKGYYDSMHNWVAGNQQNRPIKPTPLDLKTAYGYLTGSKMVSDELILRSGEFKILFGAKSDPRLQAKFVVVRSPNSTLTDIQIKIAIIDEINSFFDINSWNFGESFNFTELATSVHNILSDQIASFVIVPKEKLNLFGNLFQINAEDHEILIPHVTVDDIEFATSLTPTVLNI
jgi:hypothetical protein